MQKLVALLLVVALLAGCADAPQGAPADGMTAADTETLVDEAADAPPEVQWVEEVVPITYEGNLGPVILACDWNVVQGCPVENSNAEVDFFVDRPGAIWNGLDLTLTWTATTPATEELGFGAMDMGLEYRDADQDRGTSPLTLEATDLGIELTEDVYIHAYVWNARTWTDTPGSFIYATPDDPISIEGTVTLLVPTDAARI